MQQPRADQVEMQAEAEAAEAAHQSKLRSISKLLIQRMQQRFMPSLYVLKSIHARWFHNSWDPDVLEQMAV
jgi:hypothetical protein